MTKLEILGYFVFFNVFHLFLFLCPYQAVDGYLALESSASRYAFIVPLNDKLGEKKNGQLCWKKFVDVYFKVKMENWKEGKINSFT